jgi:UDP-N-acetylmuramoyl-tripeptide--D-alanyl-D-alanine ligase
MKNIFKKIIIGIIEWQSHLVIKKYRPYIIAITGSVGKTSAKEAVYFVISSKYHTRKSQKSFNSEIGVPLTVLGCPTGWSNPFVWLRNIFKGFVVLFFTKNYPKYLVLEVGADRPGDIKRICGWLSPDTGIVTAIGETPVHIENFPSRADLVAEKSELVRAISSSGRVVLNADDESVVEMRSLFEGKPLFYGFSERAEIKASHYGQVYNERGDIDGFSFKVNYNGSSVPFTFKGFLGRQHVYAVLAGVSVGVSQGINMVDIQKSLDDYRAEPGRVRIIEGKNNSVIIDDSYNASPTSVGAVLNELKDIETKGRKIAVLGDMMELGKFSNEEHKKIGKKVSEICDYVFSVGARGRMITDEVKDKNKVKHFSNSFKISDDFPLKLRGGDVVLVKGSQAVRMEIVTKSLMNEPEKAKDLLVRQEKHWEKIS